MIIYLEMLLKLTEEKSLNNYIIINMKMLERQEVITIL